MIEGEEKRGYQKRSTCWHLQG